LQCEHHQVEGIARAALGARGLGVTGKGLCAALLPRQRLAAQQMQRGVIRREDEQALEVAVCLTKASQQQQGFRERAHDSQVGGIAQQRGFVMTDRCVDATQLQQDTGTFLPGRNVRGRQLQAEFQVCKRGFRQPELIQAMRAEMLQLENPRIGGECCAALLQRLFGLALQ
jgi:hypothetical protein